MPNKPTTRNKIRTTHNRTNRKPAAKQDTNLNGYEKINLLIVMAIFMDKKFFKNIGITPRFFEHRIKGSLYQKPGDFIVEEILKKNEICCISKENVRIKENISTKYIHATLVKKNISTFDACSIFARENLLDYSSEVSFCGLKDTNGLTAQRICFKNNGKIKKTEFNSFFLKDFSFSDKKLAVGEHLGNRFAIKITKLKTKRKKAGELLQKFSEISAKGLPNFYGPQRFGIRQNNHKLGKLLLQKKYSDFIFNFLTYNKNESSNTIKLRKELEKKFGNWKACLKIIGNNAELKDEKELIENLSHCTSEIDAIKKIRTSGFFVHGYSSFLFNLALSSLINERHENVKIEKIGKNTKFDELNKKLFFPILKKEGITLSDFNHNEKNFCVNNHLRNALFYPKNFKYAIKNNKINLQFDLEKGEYASILLNFIVETDSEKLN